MWFVRFPQQFSFRLLPNFVPFSLSPCALSSPQKILLGRFLSLFPAHLFCVVCESHNRLFLGCCLSLSPYHNSCVFCDSHSELFVLGCFLSKFPLTCSTWFVIPTINAHMTRLWMSLIPPPSPTFPGCPHTHSFYLPKMETPGFCNTPVNILCVVGAHCIMHLICTSSAQKIMSFFTHCRRTGNKVILYACWGAKNHIFLYALKPKPDWKAGDFVCIPGAPNITSVQTRFLAHLKSRQSVRMSDAPKTGTSFKQFVRTKTASLCKHFGRTENHPSGW